jgi:glutamate-ammonia-ligase adenylyltransferase
MARAIDEALAVRLADEIGPARRARVQVEAAPDGRFAVAAVAPDTRGLFALICGLLAAHGLDVESGWADTLVRPSPGSRPPRRLAADVFRVRPRATPPDGDALERELGALLGLVADGRAQEARERIHVRLVETLEALPAPREGPEAVSIGFGDVPGAPLTAMDVGGPDTPGFLYALASALALRGVDIRQVAIESVGGRAQDRFLVAHADGRALRAEERAELGRAVALIRHFTRVLPGAPDPGRALRSFDQLLDRTAGQASLLDAFASDERLHDLARFLGSSAFLWEDQVRDRAAQALPLLAAWRERPLRGLAELRAALRDRLLAAVPAEWPGILRLFRDEESLLIETRRLLDPLVGLDRFAGALSDLGEALVAEALRAAFDLAPSAAGDERPQGLAAMALGKFGGRELGHASDLELLFVHRDGALRDFDAVVRAGLSLLAVREGSLFHVDLRLRPHGSKGGLASPLRALADYYRPGGGAAAFERQALIKLRFVAGDREVGGAVESARDAFVWSAEPWDRASALHLRERQVRELVAPGRFNVKLSRGGLVDAEYAVQYLQLRHGHERPELRTATTLVALDRLHGGGLLSADEHAALRAGYVFWREVADAMRVVRGYAGDLLLPEEGTDEHGFLARRLGYAGGRAEAGARLAQDVTRHREALAAVYDGVSSPRR